MIVIVLTNLITQEFLLPAHIVPSSVSINIQSQSFVR